MDKRLEFTSLEQFLAYVESPSDMRTTRASHYSDHQYNGTRFMGTDTFDEAIKLARYGWDEGTKMIEEMSLALTDEIIKTIDVPEIRFDVTGDELDIGRFVEGEPEDFMELVPVEIEQEPKVLKVVVAVGALANVEGRAMMRKGEAAVALIDALEKCGKRIEVDVVSATSNRSSTSATIVRVKEANEPVNLATLAFALAHPSMLRRLFFANREHWTPAERSALGINLRDGYGRTRDVDAEDRGDIYIGFTQAWDNDADVMAWVLDQLEKQGVKVLRAIDAA